MKRKLAQSVSSLPFATNDGGAWLKKALDPAELGVDVVGMPDTNTNPRTVINYQMQSDILVPDSDTYVATTVSTYDADLYLFQDPIIFGMSASYPAGTKDPSSAPFACDFTNTTDTRNLKITFAAGTAPRTVQVYLNSQIEGSSLAEKKANFTKYCQKFRMIYGGVQGIPACSEMFDSGTIEATQQIFNPEISPSTDIGYSSITPVQGITTSSWPADVTTNGVNLNKCMRYNAKYSPNAAMCSLSNKGKIFQKVKYHDNDFPDSGIGIQNPTTLYCRYKEGVYMPYKIRNPLNHLYKNSEENWLEEAPYITSTIAFYSCQTTDGYVSGPLDYDAATRTLSANLQSPSQTLTVFIKCFTKTGIAFWLCIGADTDTTLGTYTVNIPSLNIKPYTVNENEFPLYLTGQGSDQHTLLYVMSLNANLSTNLIDTSIPEEPPKALAPLDTNIGVVCFRSIAVQAAVRLIFRLGFELMIVAGGIYSPFKRSPPRYDQRAIDSYISAVHTMRDAFYGDAATTAGHDEYSMRISELVTGNLGSSWYGNVGV